MSCHAPRSGARPVLLIAIAFLLGAPLPALAATPFVHETVNATGSVGFFTSLALDAQGNPRISYYDNTNDDLKLTDSAVHLLSPVGGERWAAGSLQTVRWRGAGSVSILISDDGGRSYTTLLSGISTNAVGVTVPALTTEQARVRVSRISPFSTSDSPGYFMIAPDLVSPWWAKTVDAAGSVGSNNSLALDAQGNPRISYFDFTNFDLEYASKSGAVWTLETVDATGNVGQNTSLALDASGNPRISYLYLDATNGDLKYASKSGAVWTLETVDATGSVGFFTSLALDAQGNPRISYQDGTNGDLKYASAAIELAEPSPGVTWPVGASRTVTWDGTGRVGFYLSTDGGNSWQLQETGLTGGEYRMIVPHTPTRFAQVKLERAVPASRARTAGLFTIETSVALLSFAASLAPEGGAMLSWSTDPGPQDLAGYRLERSGPGSADWRTLVALTRETSYRDAAGSPGSRYRLFAVNGLGEELLLGEASLLPARPLAAWPLPYRGGALTVSLASGGLAGAGGEVEVALFDVRGRRVRELVREARAQGYHQVVWDGRGESGEPLANGVYFLRLRSAGIQHELKVAVLR